MKINFIAWTRYNRRTELLAQHLGIQPSYIYRGRRGKYLQAPARYAAQTMDTWRLLTRGRPDLVIVQSPPVFAPMVVAMYARRYGVRYAIDAHTGAFLSPRWRWSQPLFRPVARGAITTIVTNDHLSDVVEGWGGRADILAFTPGHYPAGEPFPFSGPENSFRVAVANTFEIDEPLDVVFEAARRVPDVTFYVTGNPSNALPQLLEKKPHNVQLTGFLPYGQYVDLLRGSQAVMDLTTRDHTLLLGAFEAVSLGTPLIVSDWPVLKSYFNKGTIWTPNTVDGVAESVQRAQRELDILRRDIVVLRAELQAQWEHSFGKLRGLFDSAVDGGVTRASMQAG